MNEQQQKPKEPQPNETAESFYLSKSEKRYFQILFNERCNERNEILYSEFKEIVYNYKRFEDSTTKGSIDKIKRKNSISSLTEADMLISKLKYNNIALDDYLNFIEIIAMEHEKSLNEKDPELGNVKFV